MTLMMSEGSAGRAPFRLASQLLLAEFTRENRGAHARLEIIGADSHVGFQVEAKIDPSTVFRSISKPISKRGTQRVDHLRHNDNGPSVAWRTQRRRDPDVTSHRTHRRSVGDRKRRWREKHPLSGDARSIRAAVRPLKTSPRHRYR